MSPQAYATNRSQTSKCKLLNSIRILFRLIFGIGGPWLKNIDLLAKLSVKLEIAVNAYTLIYPFRNECLMYVLQFLIMLFSNSNIWTLLISKILQFNQSKIRKNNSET